MGSFFAFILIQDRISSAGCFDARDASRVTASVSNASMLTITRFLDEAVLLHQLLDISSLSICVPPIYKYLMCTWVNRGMNLPVSTETDAVPAPLGIALAIIVIVIVLFG